MAYASALAGMAFANAFLGVMHSCAHKLSGATGLTHGICNALMMEQVLRFNANPAPPKWVHSHNMSIHILWSGMQILLM